MGTRNLAASLGLLGFPVTACTTISILQQYPLGQHSMDF